jgi:SWI/SNF-related matrix-associated actin-dependent regulator of chromatin subfamily A3
MGSIALRRTKSLQLNGQPLVALPPKTLHLVSVQLDADSQDKYDRWQAAGEAEKRMVAAGA